jgi:hypothetical protein
MSLSVIVKFDPRAPSSGLASEIWCRVKTTRPPPCTFSCAQGGTLWLKEAYPHDIYIGLYQLVGMKYVLQKDLLGCKSGGTLAVPGTRHSPASTVGPRGILTKGGCSTAV